MKLQKIYSTVYSTRKAVVYHEKDNHYMVEFYQGSKSCYAVFIYSMRDAVITADYYIYTGIYGVNVK